MLEPKKYYLKTISWKKSRPDITKKVEGKSLVPELISNHKVVLTRVQPSGEFKEHSDPYHHIFYFMKGSGKGMINDEEYQIEPGLVVEIPAGTNHAYKNTGKKEMLLLTINIPQKDDKKKQ
jgi:quercetin dioxygenase-like cupin family protein